MNDITADEKIEVSNVITITKTGRSIPLEIRAENIEMMIEIEIKIESTGTIEKENLIEKNINMIWTFQILKTAMIKEKIKSITHRVTRETKMTVLASIITTAKIKNIEMSLEEKNLVLEATHLKLKKRKSKKKNLVLPLLAS